VKLGTLILSEENKLRAFGNKVLKRILVLRREE
jgi:hypothetical protein